MTDEVRIGDWIRLVGPFWKRNYPDAPEYVQITEADAGTLYADPVGAVGRIGTGGKCRLYTPGDGNFINPENGAVYVPDSEVPDEIRFKGHPSTHVSEQSSTFADLVTQKTTAIADLLVEKNRKYGDSALNPANVFSKANAVEALKVRIDDKINRIRQGESDDTEDSVTDLIGYLILLQIATEETK